MKTILTFGVFDVLHLGHILLFKHIKELFQDEQCILIVAVQENEAIMNYKNAVPWYSTDQRVFMVYSIKYVDQVIVYRDVDKDIVNIDFDVFVKGPDQCHRGFQNAEEWCKRNNKMVIEIPRTEWISSSMIKEKGMLLPY